VEIKSLSMVEIKLSHTAASGLSNLQTHQTSRMVNNQGPIVYLMAAEHLSLSMDASFSKCSDIEINCINRRILTLEGPNKNIFL
jgi:hypothetical protein